MSLVHCINNHSRVGCLRQLLAAQSFVRVTEAHNGLSGLIANDTKVTLPDGTIKEFDAIWESSLTDSASKGYPDIEVVGFDSRWQTIEQILEVTDKPMIVDGDTGGDFNQFEYMVKRLERAGVSAVIIEDKVFPKRNSLEAGARQDLERIEVFAEKIRRGVRIKTNPDFLVIGRIESLIAGTGMADAVERAQAYLAAGADGLMIHSKNTDGAEILEFAEKYKQFPETLRAGKVLVCVPTTYNTITDTELAAVGFNVIIHANHLLRSAYRAMTGVAEKILTHDRSFEVDSDCATVKQIFKTVGFLSVKDKDAATADTLKSKVKVIIPAAGESALTKAYQSPVALLDIAGKTVLQRQTESLRQCGLDNTVVVTGYEAGKFTMENIRYCQNNDYNTFGLAHSIMAARADLAGPFIYLNSDILFHENILRSLLECQRHPGADIVLMLDAAYQYHRVVLRDKILDLVRTNRPLDAQSAYRQVTSFIDEDVQYVGKKINPDIAQYEFIGMAYFSERGAAIFKEVYDSLAQHQGSFQEAVSFDQASFTDMIQEIIDRGYPVKALHTHQGWMEVHTESDLTLAREIYRVAQPQPVLV